MELENKIINAANKTCEGFCLIKNCDQKKNKNGALYLDITLADAGGEMNAKLWDYSPERHGTFHTDDIVKVRGTVDYWNNQPQFKVDRIRLAADNDTVDVSELIPSSPVAPEEILAYIRKTVDAFEDGDYKAVVNAMLDRCGDNILKCSAAVRMHHAVRGGLLYHTLALLKGGEAMCRVYPFLNRELLLSGIIIHDLDKISELESANSGLASGYTPYGTLVGHLCGGAINLNKLCEKLGTDSEKAVMLSHILLSHHGIPEYGSPVAPMFPEAEVISTLDNLDAHLYQMCEHLEETPVGQMTPGKVFGLDRKLYRHREDVSYRIEKLNEN